MNGLSIADLGYEGKPGILDDARPYVSPATRLALEKAALWRPPSGRRRGRSSPVPHGAPPGAQQRIPRDMGGAVKA